MRAGSRELGAGSRELGAGKGSDFHRSSANYPHIAELRDAVHIIPQLPMPRSLGANAEVGSCGIGMHSSVPPFQPTGEPGALVQALARKNATRPSFGESYSSPGVACAAPSQRCGAAKRRVASLTGEGLANSAKHKPEATSWNIRNAADARKVQAGHAEAESSCQLRWQTCRCQVIACSRK